MRCGWGLLGGAEGRKWHCGVALQASVVDDKGRGAELAGDYCSSEKIKNV